MFEETSKDVVGDGVEATKGWLRVVEADGGDVVGGGTKISGVAVLTMPIRDHAKRDLRRSLVNKRLVGQQPPETSRTTTQHLYHQLLLLHALFYFDYHYLFEFMFLITFIWQWCF